MADSKSTISKKNQNCWILNILIQHVAPIAVRKLFDDKIPPNELAFRLNRNVHIIQSLVCKKVINVHEQDILARIPGFQLPSMPSPANKTATSSKDFDLTLMICILRNLKVVQPPSSGWDNLPPGGDNSLGAHLSRIKVYRNNLSHRPHTRINDKTFEKIWSLLTDSLSEISCGETDNIVREIKSFDFKGGDSKQLLCIIQKELREIRCDLQFHQNWKVNTAHVLNEWKAELGHFYETQGAKEVIKKLTTNNSVMIIGNSGIGKTATMKYVSLLFEKQEYEVVLISSPKDIPIQRFSERKQLFIMDDIIGKYRVDSVAVELWKTLHDRLRVVFKDKHVKLLSTLRRQLYNIISPILFPTVFNSTIVDLESNDLVLSSNEKKAMLQIYFEKRNITEHLDDKEMLRICRCQMAFPLLCNLFTSNQEFFKMKSSFFRSPSNIFKEELSRLQQENQEVYCILVFLVIFTLEELQAIFDINCEIERIVPYNKILRACEVSESVARKTLHRQLQSVAGTYVKTTNIFSFQHDKLEETIACHFGSQFPDIMLQYCKLDFIRDRVRLTNMPTDDDNKLDLKKSSFDVFSERVIDEIIGGRFRDILLCEPMQCEKFIEHFALFIKKNQLALKEIENVLCSETFLPSDQRELSNRIIVSRANRIAILEELQSRKKRFIHWVAAIGCIHLFKLFFKINENTYRHTLLTDLLHLAVSGENIDNIKLLIDRGGNLTSYDEFGIPIMCKIASTNRCDIAELLIDNGADVNQTDQILGWTPCFVATWFNEAEMLTFLLSRGANINAFDFQTRVPLAIGVIRNNTQAVSVLINNGAQINSTTEVCDCNFEIEGHFSFLLEKALNFNNTEIIKMLTENIKRKNQITLTPPVAIRKKDIMRQLLNLFLTEIKSDNFKSSLWNDFIEVCDAIYNNDMHRIENVFAKGEELGVYTVLRGVSSIKKRKNMLATFDENYLRLCPLHVSAICDNTRAAEFLIRNGANPFQRDVRQRTSLHFVNSREMITVLLNTNDEPKYSRSFSPISFAKTVLKGSKPKLNPKVNVKDINGNSPIHSLIIRMTEPSKCLDAVETLIENGADTTVRCNGGHLPIDHLKLISLRLEEPEIDRGEYLLGGDETDSYVRKEKWSLSSVIIIFIALYISLSFYFVSKKGNSIDLLSGKYEESYFQWIGFFQIFYVFILNRFGPNILFNIEAFSLGGIEMKAIRSELYSEMKLFRFSEKIEIVFVSIRTIAYTFNNVYSTHVFFHVYLFIFCLYFFILFISRPYRRRLYRYYSIYIFTFRIILVCHMCIWILYLFIFSGAETTFFDTFIIRFHWSEFFLFSISKVMIFLFFMNVFIPHLWKQLLVIKYQPIFFYKQNFSYLISMALLVFYIAEILLVPLTLMLIEAINR